MAWFDIGTALYHLAMIGQKNTWENSWCSWIIIPFSAFAGLFSGQLLILHTKLILQNKTSKELRHDIYLKEFDNPYTQYFDISEKLGLDVGEI